jgi:quercetin dioxygenase-like cupin family protein
MKIVPGREPGATARHYASAATFTGDVWIDPILERTGEVAVNAVFFAPGARTHWHRHGAGQLLYVTGGEGWVGTRGATPARVRVGDTAWTPPGEEHWHGATAEGYLLHLGVTLGEAEWGDEVTADEYPGPP